MRVCIGYKEVAGYSAALAQGLENIGVQVLYANIGPNPYAYKSGRQGWLVRAAAWLEGRRAASSCKPLYLLPLAAVKAALLMQIALACDAVITPGDSTLLRGWEWRVYKLFGVKFIAVFLGSDCRPPYISGAYLAGDAPPDPDAIAARTHSMKRYIRDLERYASVIVADRASAHFFSKQFVDYQKIGFPRLLPGISRAAAEAHGRLAVLHAPSRPKQKGSDIFRDIIARLHDEGLAVDYRELVGVPNAEVMRALADCDFVLDELYSDLPLAGFGSEAAMYGKPAVVGSYAALSYSSRLDSENLPSVMVPPEEAEGAVRRLVQDAGYRRAMGEKARRYLEENWAANIVAERYAQLIKSDYPAEWITSPAEVDYLYGWGVTREALRDFLKSYIGRFGASALALDDKPDLRKRFVDFAGGADV